MVEHVIKANKHGELTFLTLQQKAFVVRKHLEARDRRNTKPNVITLTLRDQEARYSFSTQICNTLESTHAINKQPKPAGPPAFPDRELQPAWPGTRQSPDPRGGNGSETRARNKPPPPPGPEAPPPGRASPPGEAPRPSPGTHTHTRPPGRAGPAPAATCCVSSSASGCSRPGSCAGKRLRGTSTVSRYWESCRLSAAGCRLSASEAAERAQPRATAARARSPTRASGGARQAPIILPGSLRRGLGKRFRLRYGERRGDGPRAGTRRAATRSSPRRGGLPSGRGSASARPRSRRIRGVSSLSGKGEGLTRWGRALPEAGGAEAAGAGR